MTRAPSILFLSALLGLAALGYLACSSDAAPGTTPTTDAGPGGGPVSGAADEHCAKPTKKVQPTDSASCHPDAGPPVDAGKGDAAEGDGAVEDPYGATMFNAEGDDDDCKYHMKFSVTPTHQAESETFTVTVTKLSDGKSLTGAAPRAEVFLDETHPAPDTPQKAAETTPGTYTVGPIKFDKPGKWTARFHVFEDCSDLVESSPHGHAAFYVSVP